MSNRRNERLPEMIYIRRRIAAAVIILVLVVLVVWGLVAFANSGSDDDGDPSPVPTTTAEADPASAANAAADETADETPEATDETEAAEGDGADDADGTTEPTGTDTPETTSEAVAAKDSCELADLRITATSDRPSYAPDAQPTFYMTVDNPTAVDCEIDLDDNVLRFEVYNMDNNRRVWADTDCYPSVEAGTRTFPGEEERHFEAVWSRLGSQPGQCSNRQPVDSGSYYLHAVIGGNPSDAHPFNLG